jgi:hypothetical protein
MLAESKLVGVVGLVILWISPLNATWNVAVSFDIQLFFVVATPPENILESDNLLCTRSVSTIFV